MRESGMGCADHIPIFFEKHIAMAEKKCYTISKGRDIQNTLYDEKSPHLFKRGTYLSDRPSGVCGDHVYRAGGFSCRHLLRGRGGCGA